MGKAGRDKGDGSMSELDGFVVYRLDEGKGMYISASPKQVRISAEAYRRLGCPDYINVFFDECGQRVMFKRSDETLPNALKIIPHQGGKNRTICNKPLTEKIRSMLTTGIRINGHKAGEDTVIFEVKGTDPKRTK